MNSSARFWAVAAGVVLLTAAPKLLIPASPPTPASAAGTPSAQLARFLTAHGATVLSEARTPGQMAEWTGWRMQTGGCSAIALPLMASGEQDQGPARYATPQDRVAFVYGGRTTDRPPWLRAAVANLISPFARRLGLEKRTPFYVGLIHPAGCGAVRRLPWNQL